MPEVDTLITEAEKSVEGDKPPVISEIDAESSLEDMQAYLVAGAKSALRQPSFAARNTHMAEGVGLECALLAARSIEKPEVAERLIEIFTRASEESGKKFSKAFDDNGEKLPEESEIYNKAVNAAGGVALNYLPSVLEASGIEIDRERYKDLETFLGSADFRDVLRLVGKQLARLTNEPLDLSYLEELTPDKIKTSLHETAKDDYFVNEIDTLPFADKPPLDDDGEQALDLAARLANTTWKGGQVHRAAWEGNDSRIDPKKREAFNTFDILKITLYKRLIDEGKTPDEALVRVALEVYKDILQYKDALSQPKQVE